MSTTKMNKADQFAADILRVRGLDFPRLGMRIEMDGEPGTIEGMNSAGNLNVVFANQAKYGKKAQSVHPTWEMVYYDVDGNIVGDFRTKKAAHG